MRTLIEGPTTTDFGGDLNIPVIVCCSYTAQCKNFGVHDRHYFYCSVQDAENKRDETYHYPWKGAGKQLRDNRPDSGCPFIVQEK